MRRYLFRRLLLLIPTLYFVVSLVFLLIHLIPGDPVDFILGERAMAADRERLTHELKLDQPLWEQHVSFVKELLRGDLGRSLYDHRSVSGLLREKFPATFKLAVAAMFVALAIGIPFGLIAAIWKDGGVDHSAMLFALLGISIPHFYLGPLLILIFSIHFGWFPVAGDEAWLSLVLPAFTLGTALAAILSRMTRAAMLEVMRADYVRTARAKGLSEWRVRLKHAFRSALLPVVTIVGLQFGALLAGTVVTEKIFNWPGIGSLMLGGIERRDYPVVQGCVLTIAFTFIAVNLLTDLFYAWLDPRVKLGRE
ncbi:MAG TPA: glutathione ABC transporter permease GsiC [Deltaproteobacteria bacterium]|nr:glutathione ABC transporter permease GsiC [Deltaproteobacteria bacterium]